MPSFLYEILSSQIQYDANDKETDQNIMPSTLYGVHGTCKC